LPAEVSADDTVLRNPTFWNTGSRSSNPDQPYSTMALERAGIMAAYANLVEQAILGPCGAGGTHSPHEQELLASTGKGRPAGIIIANGMPGSPFSFKTVAHPVNESLEASTDLSPSLRIAPPAGGTSASNGREGKRWT
jgi:hypothetical protein